jgi:hypothetical protein
MTEPVAEKMPSLLPYLDASKPGLKFCLNAAIGSTTPNGSSMAHFDVPGPFSGLLHGAVTPGAGQVLGDVFFLFQPDHYATRPSELEPVTNPQIDTLWQAAFARLRTAGGAFPPALPEQVDARGRLLPLRPLVHCSKKARFGHLLCPRCGGALDLCRDERRLKDAGLAGYAESLERYLFCPDCCQADPDPHFYALFASPGSPVGLHDGDDLIQSFDRLLSRQDLADDLPCIGCDAAEACFGRDALVRDRLRPLFFYPFYMLMQPAPSIHVLDFLKLISGADFDSVARRVDPQKSPLRSQRLQHHRDWLASADGFLFSGGGRRFGEVLFLKLTLLDELLALSLRSPDALDEAAASMSLEGIWVHLPAQTPRLPLFWNFSLRIVDAVGKPNDAAGVSPEARRRHFLAQAWCYILWVNDRQGMTAVRGAVERLLSDPEALARYAQGVRQAEDPQDPIFGPENLMRMPAGTDIGPPWKEIWRRALTLGFELVQSARTPQGSADDFQRRLDQLRGDIRGLLFSPETEHAQAPAVAAAATPEQPGAAPGKDGDRHIARILSTLLEQWPSSRAENRQLDQTISRAAPLSEKPAPGMLPDADGDYQETVVLGVLPLPAENAAEPAKAAQDLEQTVLMAPAASVQDLEATVLIASPKAAALLKPAVAARPAMGEMEKTVFMGRPAAGPVPDVDLEETILLASPTAPRGGPAVDRRGQGPIAGDVRKSAGSEDLEQTVILQTDSSKNRKPRT